jgi:hypothetical protein
LINRRCAPQNQEFETMDNRDPDPSEKSVSVPAGPPDERESVFSTALDQKRFNANLKRRQENRDALLAWIWKNLQPGVDFGRIHIRKNCNDKYNCVDPAHYSKPSLWKPGAEKIAGMLGLNVDFPNLELYERSIIEGNAPQIVMLRCVLSNANGQTLAVGAGARQVASDSRELADGRVIADFNKTLKMAKKSAMIDAILRAGGLSEIFTQDI